MRKHFDGGRGHGASHGVLEGMNAGHFRCVDVRSLRGGNNAECWNRSTVFSPLNILWELVAIGVGAGDLNVHVIPCRGRGLGKSGRNRNRLAVQNSDCYAVTDVETVFAYGPRLNAPLSNGRCFPPHVVQKQRRGDVCGLTGCQMNFVPCQPVRGNRVVVGIEQL